MFLEERTPTIAIEAIPLAVEAPIVVDRSDRPHWWQRFKAFSKKLNLPGLIITSTIFAFTTPAFYTVAIAATSYFIGLMAKFPETFGSIGKSKYFPWVQFALSALSVFYIWDATATAANALFFQAAEDYVAGLFSDGSDMIGLVFGALRAFLLLYLGVKLIQTVNAMRQDEDWQTIARTPLIVLLVVVFGDRLAEMIVA
mgnify:CR=1 FL=1